MLYVFATGTLGPLEWMRKRREVGMRALFALIILIGVPAEGWSGASSDLTPRIRTAACDTKGAQQCQQQLQLCLKNCSNQTGCRQDCVTKFQSCKVASGCAGS